MDFLRDLLTGLIPFFDSIPVLRALLAFMLVFLLPGFSWTLVLFRGRQINYLERFVLSIGISIALVTLSVLAMNLLFGVPVSGVNAVIIILCITAVPLAGYFLRKILAR